MLETLLLIIVAGIAGLVTFLVTYARWHYGSLEKLGIPVAKPHFLLGSDPDGHKIIYQDRDLERFQKFGPVFGVYEGRVPRVFVIDPDMIRRIMVKDFDHFYDRSVQEWGHEVFDNILDFLPGEKWKTVRSALTPMFTASRIRNGGKMFVQIMDKYVKGLSKDLSGDTVKVDIKEFATPVFVEFTSEYFLAIKLPEDGNIRENYVYKMVKESINDDAEPSFVFTLMTVYPFILKMFPLFPQEGIKKFLSTLDQVIQTRKQSKVDTSSGKDFIDVMVYMMDKLDSPEYQRLGIEKITLQAQAFEMFIAGYDSIIGTISILSYYLAKNSEAQEKVLEEIDQHYSIDNLKKDAPLPELPYLTACVKEVIRLSPSFHRLERLCMKEWTYKEKGISVTIPKGMSVCVPAWATNRNPEVFKDPEEFRPERYLKNEDGIDGSVSTKDEPKNLMQFSMNSFGHGPRNCPGSRMAIEMVKAGMARIMQEFTFECRDDTKAEIQEGIPMMTRYKPIYLNFVRRNEL